MDHSTTLDSHQNDRLDQQHHHQNERSVGSYFRLAVTIVTWVVMILGLSAVASAVVLNTRVPLILYVFYCAYLAIFLWLLYSTCRNTYLQNPQGPLNYTYLICGGCTLATIGVVLATFLTAPNSSEIAVISVIVFFISLVLFPGIFAVFYCFIRGNFIMPKYMKTKGESQNHNDSSNHHHRGIDEPDSSTAELQNGFHNHSPTAV